MRTRFRSGVLAVVLPVFLSVFSGCTDMVRPELDETHAKLQALQELAGAVNWDLHILDLIVRELDDSHTILPESFRQTEDGYEVSFRDGKTIVIPFGKDGVDGVQFTPVGVRDEDGLYYWTVGGEWLLDADGNKIRAGAVDGIVPRFKVEELAALKVRRLVRITAGFCQRSPLKGSMSIGCGAEKSSCPAPVLWQM